MAYQSTTGWQYGYFKDGKFVPHTPSSGDNFGSGDNGRIGFYNTSTGQFFNYADQKDGAPGATKHEQGIGKGAILYWLDTGKYPSDGKQYVERFLNYNGSQPWSYFNSEPSENEVPRDVALDKYFNEWYSGNEGTTGVKVRDELENVFTNQANNELMLADAAFQQQALQQAQTVKAITDQVRAERMSRLKAGMSESQIANQDMQMMMANVGALNDQAAVMNQGRLQAQSNLNTAKDQAYLAYLEQASGGSQVGAAYSAANAGDLSYQVRNSLYRKYGTTWTPEQERQETLLLSGQAKPE